ncbi:Uma2 family endonuclease [Pseudonocardiaceae bacterium YIM PH 21723]|nr:Uma2 family endonuclease [Pseudonocardiaceae bacterium YIM PH 21723]
MMLMEMEIGRSARSLTVEDLEGMPDDGRRYELIDGELLVSPAPGTYHQTVSGELFLLLRQARPVGLKVMAAPFAFQLDMRNEVQPDVLVARIEDFTAKNLIGPPLLAVEILSPSTAFTDTHRKKNFYQRAGVASYWVIDPLEPRLRVYELDRNGRYREAIEFGPDEAFKAERPFPITIRPIDLLDDVRGRDLPD